MAKFRGDLCCTKLVIGRHASTGAGQGRAAVRSELRISPLLRAATVPPPYQFARDRIIGSDTMPISVTGHSDHRFRGDRDELVIPSDLVLQTPDSRLILSYRSPVGALSFSVPVEEFIILANSLTE
jgi:hypothetical protein